MRKLFRSTSKNDLITYDNTTKIATGQGDDCTTGSLLDSNYFHKYYKMIAIDLSKQQALDADPKAIQQINFTGNLNRGRNAAGQIINAGAIMFFMVEETKETILDFSQETLQVL